MGQGALRAGLPSLLPLDHGAAAHRRGARPMITTSLDESSAAVPLLPIHPLARALPPMTAEEFDLLKADIRLKGLLEPITLLDGAVLDGIHRQRACSELGIMPATVQYSGHSPAAFVLSRNVRRRHLSVGQQAAAGEAL